MSETNGVDPRVSEAVINKVPTSLSQFLSAKTEPVADETSTNEPATDSTDPLVDPTDDSQAVETESTPDATVGSDGTVYEVKGEKVTIKELLNAYETRQEISRRFGELGTEKQRLQKEKEEIAYINEKFEEMREEVMKGNSLSALQIAVTMANASGDIKDSGMKELIKQAVTIAENFHNMSEDEQSIFLEKQELDIKKKQIDRADAKRKKQEEDRALEDYYNNILNTHGLKEEELEATLADINNLPKYQEELSKKTDPKEKISYCVSWAIGKRLNKTIEAGIAKVDPKLAKDNQFRLALIDYVDPRCSVEDVAGIVKEYLQSTSRDSAKEESGASKQSAAPKQPATSNRAPTEKPKAEKQNVPIRTWADLVAKHST